MGLASVALSLLLMASPAWAQLGTVMPSPKFTALNNSGDPCSGCLLYTYVSGTTTPLATYTDNTLATPNANPVVLDSAGRATVFLSATSYKFVLKTGAGVTLWTVDAVASSGLVLPISGELVVFGGLPITPILLTALPSGTTADKTHAGTLLWSFNSANLPPGTYALEGMLIGSGGTVTASLVNLSDGAPDTAMVSIASTSTTGERQISGAITFAASGTAKTYAIKVKVSAGYGYAWLLRIVRLS